MSRCPVDRISDRQPNHGTSCHSSEAPHRASRFPYGPRADAKHDGGPWSTYDDFGRAQERLNFKLRNYRFRSSLGTIVKARFSAAGTQRLPGTADAQQQRIAANIAKERNEPRGFLLVVGNRKRLNRDSKGTYCRHSSICGRRLYGGHGHVECSSATVSSPSPRAIQLLWRTRIQPARRRQRRSWAARRWRQRNGNRSRAVIASCLRHAAWPRLSAGAVL
jgi:hypothetical protein